NDSDFFYTNLFPLKFPLGKDYRNSEIFKKYKNIFNDINTDPSNRIGNSNWIEKRYENNFANRAEQKRAIIVLKTGYDGEYLNLFFGNESKNIKPDDPRWLIKYGSGETPINIYKINNSLIVTRPNFNINSDENDKIIKKVNSFLKN
ncbi:MAG: hypothetical protein ABI550_04645, partial [Ignavibacteriaceae bacterium]